MAVVEQYSNRVITQLDGDISDSTTSIVVVSSIGAPTTGQFRALIGNEFLLVTAVVGTTWTVVRAQEGSAAAAHFDNDSVVLVLTVEALYGLVRESLNGTNVAARRELNFIDGGGISWTLTDDPTNNKIDIEAVSSTSSYEDDLTPVVLTDWTWLNQGNAVASQLNGAVHLDSVNSGSNVQQVHALYRAVPATPWVATFRLRSFGYGTDFSTGVMFLEGALSKLTGIFTSIGTNGRLALHKWNSPTSYSAAYSTLTNWDSTGHDFWFRLSDDGTNRKCWISLDGLHWQQIHTIGRTDFLTAAHVGFIVNPTNASYASTVLSSFELT